MPQHYGNRRFGPASASTIKAERRNMRFEGTLSPQLQQTHAAAACKQAMSETGGGVLSLSVGMGKTVVALWLACELGMKTLVVVNKMVLLDQWRERIQRFVPGAAVGTIQGTILHTEGCDIVVAMLQSLSQKEYDLKGFGFLVVDECNHIAAPRFSQAMLQMNCPYRLGLSATPDRKDGLTKVLVWFMGPIFLRLERDSSRVVQVDMMHFSSCEAFGGPPPTRYGKLNFEGVVETLCTSTERNAMIVKRVEQLLHRQPSRHVLILSARRPHCFALEQALGAKARVYLGGMSQSDLTAASQSQVVVATYSMAAEGLDIPTLNTLLLATPKRDVVQACGRIMRGEGGDVDPIIMDIKDEWACTKGQWAERVKLYKRLGYVFSQDQGPKGHGLTSGECLF